MVHLRFFAPTDEAFGKLPEGTVEGLLMDIPKFKINFALSCCVWGSQGG